MDWTGGTRRRYAGKGRGNATLQKQKAHFARARAGTGYKVTPGSFTQTGPAIGGHSSIAGHQPWLVEPPAWVGKPRNSQSREASDGRGVSPSPHRQNPPRDADYTIHKIDRLKDAAPTHQKQRVAATAEETALLSNRERLLARHDWLGLSATRPVRIKFPSDRERQRIGKRRKIDKPRARMGQSAAGQAIAHPVAGRHVPFEPMMSGAIGNNDIRVKVGTDAFLSQTHHSRPSHNSINTSLRPVSTDFGPISEESMLLKADSAGFETQGGDRSYSTEDFIHQPGFSGHNGQQLQHFPAHHEGADYPGSRGLNEWDTRSRESLVSGEEYDRFLDGSRNNDSTFQTTGQYSHAMPMHVREPGVLIAGHSPDPETIYENGTGANMGHDAIVPRAQEKKRRKIAGTTHSDHDAISRLQSMVADRPALKSRKRGELEMESSMFPEASPSTSLCKFHSGQTNQGEIQSPTFERVSKMHISGDPDEDDEDDERIWKGYMQVRQAVSSRVSMAVLRSSSLHETPSTTSVHPTPTFEADLNDDMLDDQEILDEHFLAARPAKYHNANSAQSDIVSTLISSPPSSHRQILQLVRQIPVEEVFLEGYEQEDDLWRQFVVGSQSSRSQSSEGGKHRLQRKSSDELLPAQLSPIESTGEQLRSDRMTTGGSTYAAVAVGDDSQEDQSSQNQPNTSLIGHATTVDPETDDRGDQFESATHHRRETFDAHAHSRRRRPHEPRRRARYAPVPRVVPHVRKKTNIFARPRNIYDLSVASDD